MRFAEGQSLGNEVVRDVGRQGVAALGGRAHSVCMDAHGGNHTFCDAERWDEGIDGIEQAFFVLLHVAVVCEGDSLHGGQQTDEIAVDPSGLAACDLREVGVALLRHDAAAGRVSFVEPDESKLIRRPEDEFLSEAREVHGADRRGGMEFE